MVSTHVLFETTKYELHTLSADGWTRNRYFQLKSLCMKYNRTLLQWVIRIQNQNIDFWFTHLQMDYEAHIWWFWRVHEYSSNTEYEGQTPNRNGFIWILLFSIIIGLSYKGDCLLSSSLFSLKIGSDIIKIEKYLDLGFSMRCSRPHDPADLQLSSPNSPCNYPNDVDTSLLFFCIFLSPANMLCWTSSYQKACSWLSWSWAVLCIRYSTLTLN